MDILVFVIGVTTGVLGNFATHALRSSAGWIWEPYKIKGIWIEKIHSGEERVFSLGRIRKDLRRGMWTFEGTNYHNDGTPFCHWRTVTSHLDKQNKRFYYTFLNTPHNSTHTSYTGFGFLELTREGRHYVPTRGSFAAGNPKEQFRSHSIVKIEALPQDQRETQALFSKHSQI